MNSICVLMSTYNGQNYLRYQLDSVLAQKNVSLKVLIRDDGSKDSTVEILKEYSNDKRIKVIVGKNLGYKLSFLELMKIAPDSDYYAFCDQDDVWDEDKLIVAINKLSRMDSNLPLLYTSSLQCTDAKLNPTHIQSFKKLKLDMYSEFVRHRFAGCTFVFNKELRDIVVSAKKLNSANCPHDTLITLVCWACGGKVYFDETPHIRFRRHGNNTSVDGMSIKKRIKKEFAFLHSDKNYKYDLAKFIINNYDNKIGDSEKSFFCDFLKYKTSFIIKFRMIFGTKLNCGIWSANLLFRLGMIVNSI